MKKLVFVIVIIIAILLYLYTKFENNRGISFTQTNMELCKSRIMGDEFPISEIKKLLNNQYGPLKEYFALKSEALMGMNYFLLINYETKSLIITYLSRLGLRSRTVSIKEGKSMFSMLATNDYKKAKSEYGYDDPHISCEFIKIKDSSNNKYFIEILNGGENLESPTISIRNNISKVISFEYKNNYLNANGIELERVPNESSENEINEFNIKLNDDMFYELKTLDK